MTADPSGLSKGIGSVPLNRDFVSGLSSSKSVGVQFRLDLIRHCVALSAASANPKAH
jgi:hypothetical protein